jgi:serine/threonine-protein kinase HipA
MNKPIECHVRLWGEDVGTIAQIDHKIYFQYESTFLNKHLEISPLHLAVEKKVYETTHLSYFEGLAGVFADALPDSWGSKIVENYFLKYKKIPPYEVSSVQKLLYMGNRGVGALEFFPAQREVDNRTKQILEISELLKDSRKILKGDIVELLPELFRISSDSLGGAKAKATVGLNVQSNEIITTQHTLPDGFEHWMIKFDGTDEKGTPSQNLLAEKLYLDMAKMCGIESVESRIIYDGELSHLAVKRFDRSGNKKPFHMHTLAGLAHINFKDKDTMSYDKFFRTILAVTNDYAALEEGYKRMVFNVLSGNQDDHAKNHTFLMDKKGKWILSPAYDISPTFEYGHQMDINFKDKGVTHKDLMVMAEKFGIKDAREILQEQVEVLQGFAIYAKELGLHREKMAEIFGHFKMQA